MIDTSGDTAVNLITEIIHQTINLGHHFVHNSTFYGKEVQESTIVIDLQLGIWKAALRNLKDEPIIQPIRDEVLTSFARGSEELYSLMQKFVARKCEYKAERKRILELYSADDSIAKLDELQIPAILPAKERESNWRAWIKLKEEAGYLVLKESKRKQMVTEIVFWGNQLNLFSHWLTSE